MDKEKKQAISNAIEAMINVPYDVTEAEQAKKIQQQATEIRNKERPEGRYTIGDAVILLRAETGDYYPLVKAVESGDIPCYKHEAGDKKGDPQDLRSYVCWDDLNKWIEEKTDIRKFRFPNPNAPAAKGEAVQGTSTSGEGWEAKARTIADECFDHDTKMNCRDSLKGYSRRVMELMQERGIKGARGIIDNSNYVMREALQSDFWWKSKSK